MLIGNKFKVFRTKSYHFSLFFYVSARKSHKMRTISVCCVQLSAPQSAGSGRNEVCGASVFRPQTKKISSAVEINFVCGRNFFHLRMIFITKECEKDEKHENSIMGKDIEDEPPVAPMELLPR